MAATSNTTLLEDLFDPQVVADVVDTKLVDYIRFAPLAKIDTTLVGRDGDEITLPSYSYVGDAEDVEEGADIPIAKLSQTTEKVKVSKIGKGIQFTDEALLSGNANDIAEEAATQIVTAINSSLENKLITAMSETSTLTSEIAIDDDGATGIATALQEFGEDIDGEKILVVPPVYYGRLLKSSGWIPNTEIGADIIVKGTVGMVYGCQIVLSNRLTSLNEAYIIKPNALAIYMKRNTLVEFDRDIVDQTNYIIGSKIFAPYVYDKSKLIKLTLATA
ncbi:MAG: N4-gp56 family major capsid protein [Clostridiales bacterium]|nr:N4-gp56 family major capsid protein [Clostridiales bacterium]